LPELYRASFDGPVPSVRLREGTVTIQYKGGGLPWDWRKRNVNLTLNSTIPWDLELTGGSNKLRGDLAALDVRSIAMHGGADALRLVLGQPVGVVPIRLSGGASQLHVERPAGVPIQLRIDGGAGGVAFDPARLRGGARGGGGPGAA